MVTKVMASVAWQPPSLNSLITPLQLMPECTDAPQRLFKSQHCVSQHTHVRVHEASSLLIVWQTQT